MEITKQEGHSRAAKGGQFGANGEWYEGGKFIATTDHPKSCKPARKASARRVQVGPAEFTEGREGALPLWQTLSGVELFDRSAGTFQLAPLRGEMATVEALADRSARIAAYNSGKRWKLICSGDFE